MLKLLLGNSEVKTWQVGPHCWTFCSFSAALLSLWDYWHHPSSTSLTPFASHSKAFNAAKKHGWELPPTRSELAVAFEAAKQALCILLPRTCWYLNATLNAEVNIETLSVLDHFLDPVLACAVSIHTCFDSTIYLYKFEKGDADINAILNAL